jgi:Hemerythrin HHE cation binding domain
MTMYELDTTEPTPPAANQNRVPKSTVPRSGPTSAPPAAPEPRYDPYLVVHKGLRECMTQVLVGLGRMDASDDVETRHALAALRQLVELVEGHMHHESVFIHAAMEKRAPGSSTRAEADHSSHREVLAALRAACDGIEQAQGAAREGLARCLYRKFALFMAEDFVHMHAEETENNAVLWATHSDEELVRLVGALVASIPPEKNAVFCRWMVTASTPDERARMLDGGRKTMPAAAFDAFVTGILPLLSAKDRVKLGRALA